MTTTCEKPPIHISTDPTWRKLLRDHNAEYVSDPRGGKGLLKLRELLLKIGGGEVCLCFEEDLRKLLTRGKEFPAAKARKKKGARCRCHSNSAFLWEANKEMLRIVTGWALSADGVWRQHSFCWWPSKGVVVETTEPRTAYFGYEMTNAEAEEFVDDHF